MFSVFCCRAYFFFIGRFQDLSGGVLKVTFRLTRCVQFCPKRGLDGYLSNRVNNIYRFARRIVFCLVIYRNVCLFVIHLVNVCLGYLSQGWDYFKLSFFRLTHGSEGVRLKCSWLFVWAFSHSLCRFFFIGLCNMN